MLFLLGLIQEKWRKNVIVQEKGVDLSKIHVVMRGGLIAKTEDFTSKTMGAV